MFWDSLNWVFILNAGNLNFLRASESMKLSSICCEITYINLEQYGFITWNRHFLQFSENSILRVS